MSTKNIVIAILIVVVVLLLLRNYALMQPSIAMGKPVQTYDACLSGSFLITKDYSAEQFKFDVNTPTTKNLKVVRKGECFASTSFIIRKNSGQEEKIVTFDGFDITEAGNLIS
jgi:hypothetical protein